MINKKDIEARYAINPEPLDVSEARKLIEESFKDLRFIEESHQYFVGDQELPPVSTVCHKFEPYVDWDSIASRKAAKLGMTKEQLQEEWHQNNITSTSCGSKTHWFGEQMMNLWIGREPNLPFQYTSDGYMIPYAPKEKAIEKYWTDILGNPRVYPVMPEAKIYRKDLGYAGTFDILLAYQMKDHIGFSIHDYKGLPLDTKILTKDGWKTMGTLELGDEVQDRYKEWQVVQGISEVHMNPCFRITFTSGYSITADHEHRWVIDTEKIMCGPLLCEMSSRILKTEELEPGMLIPYTEPNLGWLEIERIDRTETVATRCIEVSGISHTYLIGEIGLVTHNTNKDLKNDFNRSRSNRLLDPFQDFIDEPLSLYSIQLSLYQLGLEQLGLPIIDRNLIWLKEDGTYEKIGTPDLTGRLLEVLKTL